MAEEKLNVHRNEVHIGSNGELQIKDKAVLDKLKEHGISSEKDLERPNVSVGVVVSF